MDHKDIASSTTEADRRVARLESENRALRACLAASAELGLAGEVPLDEVLQRVVDAARSLLHARYAAVEVLGGPGQAAHRYVSGVAPEVARGSDPGTPETGRPQRLGQPGRRSGDPLAAGGSAASGSSRADCLAGPVERNGVVYGRLGVAGPVEAGGFAEADEELLGVFARQAAIAIENARRLAEVERLKADIIALVSHELRTPLSHIKGYASTLLQPDVEWDAATQRDFIASIERQADRLARLISDLLEISRLDAGGAAQMERVPTEPAPLVERGLRRVAPGVGDHPILTRIAPDLPSVRADPGHVERVLTNLIENAAKYSPAGEPIVVEVEPGDGEVVFSVRDRGPGLTAEEEAHLFERFYRSPRVRHRTPGTGLGLAICREIVRAHGGRIWAESAEGRGSTFAFTLPRDREGT